mmetsp:Transcript_16705/g.28943  ORF Transcript_16705/g.28943 Transcript_16705/m.28943 type:complete len:241 (-) Transcript_16705:1884-2606(-)|eukprot:CAMPEP_0196654142 /NCGR_PEP_ID=MMETSP1086-20130531/3828_1 /TAXON_ID=77921 /ORGANISM="Cyanoptyche  gloeocystis , Strain SAG4.97" /LENGTH=240 /DNA_ID=CAMNT_0041985723 /DNA_START=261 /DNA_END=983 /DNA_ORIENTATION=-
MFAAKTILAFLIVSLLHITAHSLTVEEPMADETLYRGSDVNILWSNSSSSVNISYLLSADSSNNSSWVPIPECSPSSLSDICTWSIPVSLQNSTYRLAFFTLSNEITLSEEFEISIPSLVFTSPSAGQVISNGSAPFNVTWIWFGPDSYAVEIFLTKNGIEDSTTRDSVIVNSGVGSYQFASLGDDGRYQIKVESPTDSAVTASSEVVTVDDPGKSGARSMVPFGGSLLALLLIVAHLLI